MRDISDHDTLTGFLRDLDNRITRQERHSHRTGTAAAAMSVQTVAAGTPVPFPRTYAEAKAWAEAGTMVPVEGEEA